MLGQILFFPFIKNKKEIFLEVLFKFQITHMCTSFFLNSKLCHSFTNIVYKTEVPFVNIVNCKGNIH